MLVGPVGCSTSRMNWVSTCRVHAHWLRMARKVFFCALLPEAVIKLISKLIVGLLIILRLYRPMVVKYSESMADRGLVRCIVYVRDDFAWQHFLVLFFRRHFRHTWVIIGL